MKTYVAELHVHTVLSPCADVEMLPPLIVTEALERGITRLLVRSDSELLVRQMLGEYKVKSKALQALRREAEALKRRFDEIHFEHVRREYNEIADELAKQGAEAAKERGVTGPRLQLFDDRGETPRTPPE